LVTNIYSDLHNATVKEGEKYVNTFTRTRGTNSPTFLTPNPLICGRIRGGGRRRRRFGQRELGPGREEREEEEGGRAAPPRLAAAAPGRVARQCCHAGACGAAGPGPLLGNSGKPVTLETLGLTKFSKHVFQEQGIHDFRKLGTCEASDSRMCKVRES
jgi:hypothetical protein